MKAETSSSLTRQPAQDLNTIDWRSLARAVKDADGGARDIIAPTKFQCEGYIEAWLDSNHLVRVGKVSPDVGVGEPEYNQIVPYVAIYRFGE